MPPLPKGLPQADVVVVGCGGGGGVVAKELAEAGARVVVLEAGRRYDPFRDYTTDQPDFETRDARVFLPDDPRRDLFTLGGDDFSLSRVKGVGGSTLAYLAVTPRFHPSDFRTRTEDGVGMDWPLGYAELEPYYTRVEWELGVSAPTGAGANPFEPPRSRPFPNPPHELNCAALAVKRGADRLGLHLVAPPLAISPVAWGGRPQCFRAGVCNLGCRSTAKGSIDVTYVRRAEATGRVEIRTECMAHEVVLDARGRARGVVYLDAQGQMQRVEARAVVLAAGAVETPRLLLLSTSSRFPHGLANSSGLVGRGFMEHLHLVTHARFPERLEPWRGPAAAAVLQDHYATDPRRGFARGWTTEVSGGGQWPLATARRADGWGAAHKERMRQLFAHCISLHTVGEQLPDDENRVTLDEGTRDSYGLPVPRITWKPGANDRAMVHAMGASHRELLAAAGASEIEAPDFSGGTSSHYLGTCRMGDSPERSVLDRWGRAHDVPNLFVADGSVFTTGAAVNPLLTIAALATRTADEIARALRDHEL